MRPVPMVEPGAKTGDGELSYSHLSVAFGNGKSPDILLGRGGGSPMSSAPAPLLPSHQPLHGQLEDKALHLAEPPPPHSPLCSGYSLGP